jgi:ABC-type lipoprotein export system ATPase subunit
VIETFQLVRNEYGTTIVLATHDEELAKHATKRIYLEDGRARVDNR